MNNETFNNNKGRNQVYKKELGAKRGYVTILKLVKNGHLKKKLLKAA